MTKLGDWGRWLTRTQKKVMKIKFLYTQGTSFFLQIHRKKRPVE
jgi:hypothetical protein